MKNQRDRKGKKGGKKSLIPSFLTKLYQILENLEYHNIIKWVENGRAFVVKNLPEFIEKVLPNYFKHNNFASFVRQLNMYDFHKTRNNNNENTFYHKLFIKGQKNLLKMIKRKINNSQNNQGPDDFDLLDLHQEKDFKNLSKKNLEEIFSKVLKNLDDVKAKQNEIESRIECVKVKNEEALCENTSLITEFAERKHYTKNLEFLIILILELTSTTDRNSGIYLANSIFSSYLNSLSDLDFEPCNQESNMISRFPSDTDKAFVLKSLIENCNDEVLKSMVVKCLDKYKLKLEDIDVTISKKSQPGTKYSFSQYSTASENSPAQIKENPAKPTVVKKSEFFNENKRQESMGNEAKCKIKLGDGSDVNMNNKTLASPTSILSTNDCIFTSNNINQAAQQKTPTGSNLRKKTEGEVTNSLDVCAGDLNLNQKEQDTMFEEVNGVTHFLISSPSMSPQRKKYDNSMNFNQDQNENILRPTPINSINPIFFNGNYSSNNYNNNFNNITNNAIRSVSNNQPKYNPETFFSFSDENNSNTSLLNKKHN